MEGKIDEFLHQRDSLEKECEELKNKQSEAKPVAKESSDEEEGSSDNELEEAKTQLANKDKMIKRLKDMWEESKTANKDKEAQLNDSITILNKRYRDLIAENLIVKENLEKAST